MPGFYKPEPNEIHAYYNDATHEYFGWADSGTKTSEAHWQIMRIKYNTSYVTAADPWIEEWAVDTNTGMGSDQPIFEWDNVATYTYRGLGVKA